MKSNKIERGNGAILEKFMPRMNAITVREGRTDPDALFLGRVPIPAIAAHEILIRVVAAGVNRPDIAQREGKYPPPPGASEIIGLEIAGVVEAVGANAGCWKIGDRVCALLPGGGYAEYASVNARHALPIPNGWSFEQAAALPETVFTVWANLFEAGRLSAGETVLIHGANSGIGTTAIQMAKAAGAKVITTARGGEKAGYAKSIGADRAVDSDTEDFVSVCQQEGLVDVVLDILGGPYFERNLAALKTDGRLVQIAFLAGQKVTLDLMQMLFKRLTLSASTLRARDGDEKARLTATIEQNVWPWFENGAFPPQQVKCFPLANAGAAHAWLERGEQRGKVVLQVAPDIINGNGS